MTRSRLTILVLGAALLFGGALATAARAQEQAGPEYYFRNPSGHGSTVVFEFNGRIWRQQGTGTAERVTGSDHEETSPVLSPDGAHVAYVGLLDASDEVFVASMTSGRADRLTFDGGFDIKVQGWLNPGEVLYSTSSFSFKRGPLLFAADISTGRTRPLPLVEAAEGCVLGSDFIFVKNQELIDSNRLYRGGYAQRIFRIDYGLFADGTSAGETRERPSVLLTKDYPGISRNPVCTGGRVYFLSDRDGRFNIWSMAPDGGDTRQHTFSADHDVRAMTSSDGTAIHYQMQGEIYRLDLKDGQSEKVGINISGAPVARTDRQNLAPEDATGLAVSDSGMRAALVLRGTLWSVDLASGAAACVDCGSDRRVKSPALSADGETVFALNDVSGEYGVVAYDLTAATVRRMEFGIDGSILDFSVSPNGRDMLVRTISGEIHHADARTGSSRRLQTGSRRRPEDIAWSPDGRFAAFVSYPPEYVSRITLFDTVCGATTEITSGRHKVSAPAFSQEARELYYIAEANFRSSIDDPWGTTNHWPSYDNKALVYAADISAFSGVNADRLRSAGRSASRAAEAGDCPERTMGRSPGRGVSRAELLLTGELPFVAGNYSRLSFSGGRLHAFSKRAERDDWGRIVAFEEDPLGRRSAPRAILNDVVFDFVGSATGRSILARTQAGLVVLPEAAGGGFGTPVPLRLNAPLEVEVNLAEERTQKFRELWRLYRDYFWDPQMNGVDWQAELDKYRRFLPRVSSTADFAELSGFMISELGAGHTSIGSSVPGTDARQGVARLGADFDDRDGLRITRILDGDLDIMEERAPLSKTMPPLNAGDRITHVNGSAVGSRRQLDRALFGQVGVPVTLVWEQPGGLVFESSAAPISAEHETWLRQKAWAARNAERVEARSNGTVGYIDLRSAYEPDFSNFVRQFAYLHRRKGLIVDLRGNNGGNIDPWLLHFLQLRTWLHVADRYQPVAFRHPAGSFDGDLIVLIDGDTYSDGELIAEGVRRLGLGTLIGSRTSGAGKWVNDEKTLIDGSRLRIPEAGSYVNDGGEPLWIIEGPGVRPDIAVENDPYDFYFGTDAQLEAAIDYANKVRKD